MISECMYCNNELSQLDVIASLFKCKFCDIVYTFTTSSLYKISYLFDENFALHYYIKNNIGRLHKKYKLLHWEYYVFQISEIPSKEQVIKIFKRHRSVLLLK